MYFENLDGFRAIAAILVVLLHSTMYFAFPAGNYESLKNLISINGHGGELGVHFFFVLSGFLITYLLFNEQKKNGYINLGNFYARRILRIWPLYYVSLAVGFLLYPYLLSLSGRIHTEGVTKWMYVLFATNFDHIQHGPPLCAMLGVQWSVAVEEQFYLIWPVLILLTIRSNYLPLMLALMLIGSEYFFQDAPNFAVANYHFFSCVRFLAFGGLLAYLAFYKVSWVRYLMRKLDASTIAIIYVLAMLGFYFQNQLSAISLLYIPMMLLPYLFFGFIILEQNYSSRSPFKMRSSQLLTWLGKISYGIYMTHMMAIYIVLALMPESADWVIPKILTTLLLAVFISALSYNYMESRFLKLKAKF